MYIISNIVKNGLKSFSDIFQMIILKNGYPKVFLGLGIEQTAACKYNHYLIYGVYYLKI